MSFASHVERFLEERRRRLVRGMTRAGVYWVSQERGFLNRSQPYKRSGGGKRLRGLDPSGPGQFPRKLSGQLQRSMTWDLDKDALVLRLGSNVAGYPKFLQTGTRFMAARPWLSLGWRLVGDDVLRIARG